MTILSNSAVSLTENKAFHMHKEALKVNLPNSLQNLSHRLHDWCISAPAIVADVSVSPHLTCIIGEKNTHNTHVYRYLANFKLFNSISISLSFYTPPFHSRWHFSNTYNIPPWQNATQRLTHNLRFKRCIAVYKESTSLTMKHIQM